jgi:dCMP deaminase
MKQKLLDAYMKTAETFAECSTARRLHVGAIVVKEDRIISIGYNGMPSGWDNNCEDEVIVEMDEKFIKTLITKPEVLHAETNAIAKLAKSNESGSWFYYVCYPRTLFGMRQIGLSVWYQYCLLSQYLS